MSCVELSDKFEQEALVVQHKGVSSINVSGEGFSAQFCFLLSAVCVVLSNLLGDIVNAAIDPRIRREAGAND